jgi:hypothetical protein
MENKMKKKIYTLKPTKKQLETMKLYWAMLKQEENLFYVKVYELEKNMSERVGLEDLEFFQTESGFAGIGNMDRTMNLIHSKELEKR